MYNLRSSPLFLFLAMLLWPLGILSCTGGLSAAAIEEQIQDVAQNVLPSVVELNVMVIKDANDPNNLDDRPFFEYFFENPDGSDNEKPREYRYQSLGAGVIIARKGMTYYVLSNRHVIGDGRQITVKLDDGREFTSRLVGQDSKKDIAVVCFESRDDLPVARMGDSDSLRTGSFVLALGSPYGFQSTTTLGIVSALHRRGGPSDNMNDFIQTDASINQGNSGGALVNLKAELIGINTWISSQTGDNVGLGFAIPINNIRNTLSAMIEGKAPKYGWMGVHMQSIDLEIARSYGLRVPRGILVCGVYPGSPADQAEMLPGDILLAYGNRELTGWEDLVQLVSEAPLDQVVTVKAYRSGMAKEFKVKLVERPDDDFLAMASEALWPGVVPYIKPAEDPAPGATDDGMNGKLMIRQVVQGSVMQKSGLKTRDVIVSINGQSPRDMAELFDLLGNRPVYGVEIVVQRDAQLQNLTIMEPIK